ncbi:MAG: FAD-binding oxidoreductase [Candidatus Nanohaloarchaea archaeon]|nr:FAD-binding oxidoreductase [Candidatus Nanohaloarchaea archaeon]
MPGIQATINSIEAIDEDRKDDLRRKLALNNHLLDERQEGQVRDRLDREHPSLKKFRLEPDAELDFEAGQFITTMYDMEDEDRPVVRQYSIANSYEDYQDTGELELCVRLVEDGKFTPELFDMEEGDQLEVAQPAGHFTIDETDRDKVMIATGTGIAPIRSMIDSHYHDIEPEEEGEDVWLFHGVRWEDDLAYRDEFEALEETYDSFHFVPTLSGELGWDGEDEYVQEVVRDRVENDSLDPDSIETYVCGLSPMVEYTVQMLTGNNASGADEIPEEETLDETVDTDYVNFELYD